MAKTIIITAGEPAGIGPDLCVLLAERPAPARVVIAADRELIAGRARLLGKSIKLRDYQPSHSPPPTGTLDILHVPLPSPAHPGQLDPSHAGYVLETLRRAVDGCGTGEFDALVTGPVHKGVINEAGIPFTGHTEFLADLTGTPRVVMMLAGCGLRVALATTHLALRDVADTITPEVLVETIEILHRDLVRRFRIDHPRILVAGLNPHAGEGGHLGREEIEVIGPTLSILRNRGLDVSGPFPADTLFTPHILSQGDCVLAMYHDQGLPVLKYASFGGGVNITLGLPIIRTSVDHGTALELAGTGHIDRGSLDAALDMALLLCGDTPRVAPSQSTPRGEDAPE